MTPSWSRICMYKVTLGLIARARRAVSSGRASGSGGGNDIKRLLSLLQTQLPYFTRFSFLCASFGHSTTESMYVLGQKGSRRWINFLNFKTFLLNPCVRPLE